MENDNEITAPLFTNFMRRASTIKRGGGTDYEAAEGLEGDNQFRCKPLGFLLALPFALLAIVVALIGVILWILMSILSCLCPCFVPCIAIVNNIIQFALVLISAPLIVMMTIMDLIPC